MIFCFTGTGNSLLVANGLAHMLGDEMVILRGDLLLHPEKVRFQPAHAEKIIWVFPIHSWGVPPVMVKFITSVCLETTKENMHYLVCTCGDDIGNAHKQWRKLIEERGWRVAAAYSVQMPNIYVLMKGFDVDSKEVEQEKLSRMPSRLDAIVERIGSGDGANNVVRGSWAWVKSTVIYPLFKRFTMSPKPFHAIDICTSCGKCESSCPMSNISLYKSTLRPLVGDCCALCLCCLHVCPVKAVAYGKSTIGKGHKRVYTI